MKRILVNFKFTIGLVLFGWFIGFILPASPSIYSSFVLTICVLFGLIIDFLFSREKTCCKSLVLGLLIMFILVILVELSPQITYRFYGSPLSCENCIRRAYNIVINFNKSTQTKDLTQETRDLLTIKELSKNGLRKYSCPSNLCDYSITNKGGDNVIIYCPAHKRYYPPK